MTVLLADSRDLVKGPGGTHPLIDKYNRHVKRDKGTPGYGDRVLWTDYNGDDLHPQTGAVLSSNNHTMKVRNTSGHHALFRNAADSADILDISDAGVSLTTDLVMRSGKQIQFYNAANTNSVLVHHSGTNDHLKIDTGLQVGTSLNVGSSILTGAGGAACIQGSLNVGNAYSATDTGDGWLSGGLSLGTFVNPSAGDLIASGALNVGSSRSATDAGDGWLSGGLSLGTFANPAAGQLLASGLIQSASTVQGTQLISTVAIGTAPLVVTSTTLVTNLNADLLDGHDSPYYATAPLMALCTANLTLVSGTYNPLTGATLVLTPGVWCVTGIFDFTQSVAVPNQLLGRLAISAFTGTTGVISDAALADYVAVTIGAQQTVPQSWLVTVPAASTTTVRLEAQRTTATGTSVANATLSKIYAIQGIGA